MQSHHLILLYCHGQGYSILLHRPDQLVGSGSADGGPTLMIMIAVYHSIITDSGPAQVPSCAALLAGQYK